MLFFRRYYGENSCSINDFERVYDHCVVWAPQVQRFHPVEGDTDKLVYCFRGILFPGACERIGHYQFSAAQLKIIQEVITLIVFAVFSVLYLKEGLRWNHAVAFLMIIGAVFFMFKEW